MEDVVPYAVVVGLIAAAVLLAALSNRVSERIRVPAPAIFLIVAAVVSDIVPSLGGLPVKIDERIVTVALIFILFDGGMHIGWRRFRTAAGAVLWVGVVGTVVTAGALATAAHLLFGFSWSTALLIGTALSPTDPAVVFSVLGRREIAGRSGTILEGESGANDPVGIALMGVLLGAGGSGFGAVLSGAGSFALQMVSGGLVGLAGGFAMTWLMRRSRLPNEALYPIQALACAPIIYSAATLLHGSGFLAVLLAGIVVGDVRAPYKREIERFSSGLSSLSEIVAFTVLGLTVSIREVLRPEQIWVGLAIAGLLILVIRPLLVGGLLIPIKLRRGERLFVLWAGLKGAVPILLGTFIVSAGVPEAARIYGIVFVVVLISVVVQGGLVPTAARLLHVPMTVVEPEPWSLGMRFQDEPQGMHRHIVGVGSQADGATIRDLPIGEFAWVSIVSRDGQLLNVRGQSQLQPGDEVLLLADPGVKLAPVFDAPGGRPPLHPKG